MSEIERRHRVRQSRSDRVRVGLFVHLQARPGKEGAVEEFLRSALPLVEGEPATTAWFALRFGGGSFAIFDVFPDDAGRRAHLTGQVAAALGTRAADLLSSPPIIEAVDALASKLPREGRAAVVSGAMSPEGSPDE